LFWYWHLRVDLDGYAWLQKALATDARAAPLRAMLLARAGHLAYQYRDASRITIYCEESLALFREIGDTAGMAFPLASLGGFACLQQFDSARGKPLLEESLTLYRQAGDKWGARHVLGYLGISAFAQGQFDQASAYFQENLVLARELGVPDGIGFALYFLGVIAFFQGDHDRALASLMEGLPVSRAVKLILPLQDSLFLLANIALHRDEFEQAKMFAQEVMGSIREIGLRASWRGFLLSAPLVTMLGALMFDHLALAQKSGDKLISAHGLFMLAASTWIQGQLEKATRLYAAALVASAGFLPTSMPLERTDFDHTLTGTLIQLDEATFKKAWAEGSAMTVDEAIAYALEQTG